MTRYEFQSTLFRNEADMLAAIADEFLSAGGMNSETAQSQILSDNTDEQLAAECISGWGLDIAGDETPSHMASNDYTAADLARAFRDLR